MTTTTNRPHRVELTLSKAERKYMAEQAKATGRTLSAYIRDKCVYEPQTKKP